MLNLDILEPITLDNLSELKEGDWIWDNKDTYRRIHGRSLSNLQTFEPIGFRQIDILDIQSFKSYGGKLFMLSDIDAYRSNRTWTYFELGRFYKFKNMEVKYEHSNL